MKTDNAGVVVEFTKRNRKTVLPDEAFQFFECFAACGSVVAVLDREGQANVSERRANRLRGWWDEFCIPWLLC